MLKRTLVTAPMFGLVLIAKSTAYADETRTTPEYGFIIKPAKTSLKCSERDKILMKLKSKGQSSYGGSEKETYIERKNGKNYDFVFLDSKKARLKACLNGKSFSAKLVGEWFEETVLSSDLVDFNSDGSPEFLLWHRQCAEGPCSGKRVLISLSNGNFTIRDAIRATMIEIDKGKSEWVFSRINNCWTAQFDPVLEYRTFSELDKNLKFKNITLAETKKRFPELLKKALASMETANDVSSPFIKDKQQIDALRKIAVLFKRAYQGESNKILQREFKKIKRTLGDKIPDIYCEIPEVLRDIQGLPPLKIDGDAEN